MFQHNYEPLQHRQKEMSVVSLTSNWGDEPICVLHPCSEKIFGYRGLEVQVYYTPGGLRTFVGVKYTDKLDPATSGGLKVCGRK